MCTECLLSNHLGHPLVPSKPLILGEATSEILTNAINDNEKLKQIAFTHLEAVVLKQKQSNAQIEGASLALIKEIQSFTSRMLADNEQQTSKISDESGKRVDEIQEQQKQLGVLQQEIENNQHTATS